MRKHHYYNIVVAGRKAFIFLFGIFLLASCSSSKDLAKKQLPSCLKTIIAGLSKEPANTPQSVTQYEYEGKTVYYLKSACCDKFNIVYDKDCKILGYPDGGLTGRGDGRLPDFWKKATDGVLLWKNNP